MAYVGYLVKVGDYTVPNSIIRAETYSVKPQQRLDLDSYRDTNGVLHRSVVGNRPPVITFNLKSMKVAEFWSVWTAISGNYANEDQRQFSVKYFDPETNDYNTHICYMPDIEFPIKQTVDVRDAQGNYGLVYDEITLEFIGY